MGSAAKGTIIRPIDDIDVLAVFSNEKGVWLSKYWNDSQAFIYRVRQAYAGTIIQQVGTRGQAVRVFFKTGGHVDVAPVFSQGNDVDWLPNGSGGWISTAPVVANRWFSTRNKDLGYHLAPIVHLLKAWNRAHSNRFRSFHLETVAATVFELGSDYRDALQKVDEWAPNFLDVNDPGGQGARSVPTSRGRPGRSSSALSAQRPNELARPTRLRPAGITPRLNVSGASS